MKREEVTKTFRVILNKKIPCSLLVYLTLTARGSFLVDDSDV